MIKDILKILLFLFLTDNLAFSSTSETEINFSKISKNSNGNKIKIFGKRTKEYVIKNEKVFFGNEIISDADADTFKVINGILAKDKNNVYFNGIKVQLLDKINLDETRIIYTNDSYSPVYFLKDKKNIYALYSSSEDAEIKILDEVDYNSFKVINTFLMKDKNNLFYYEISYNSFNIINTSYDYYSYDSPNHKFSIKKLNTSPINQIKVLQQDDYTTSTNGIFIQINKDLYILTDEETLKKLENFDINTFQYLGQRYLKDKNGIYFFTYSNRTIKMNVDYNSFKILSNSNSEYGKYAKDKNHIYCNGRILKEADYESFETGYGGLYGSEAYDKNNSYLFCQIM